MTTTAGSNSPGIAPQSRADAIVRIRSRRRRFFALAMFAVLLVVQEGCLRLEFPLPKVVGFNRVRYQTLDRRDARTGPLLKRGLVYDRLIMQSEPDGFYEVHQLNLYGFRGNDFTIAPARDRRRVLVIGDSFAEGYGAPETATISSVLERRFAGDGVRAEVINLGVSGAQLRQSVALARDAIALLEPTDVVFVLCFNDFPAPPYPQELDLPAPTFRRNARVWWMPWFVELVSRLANHEPIYRRWPHVAFSFFLPVPDPINPWSRAKARPKNLDPALHRAMTRGTLNPWMTELVEDVPPMLAHDFAKGGGSPERYLGRVAAACRSGNARLIVAFVPFCAVTSRRYSASFAKLGIDPALAESLATDPRYRGQNAVLADACRELEIPLADTTESLVRAEAAGTPMYWGFDCHPRPAGYSVIAQHIYDVWRRSAHAGDGAVAP